MNYYTKNVLFAFAIWIASATLYYTLGEPYYYDLRDEVKINTIQWVKDSTQGLYTSKDRNYSLIVVNPSNTDKDGAFIFLYKEEYSNVIDHPFKKTMSKFINDR